MVMRKRAVAGASSSSSASAAAPASADDGRSDKGKKNPSKKIKADKIASQMAVDKHKGNGDQPPYTSEQDELSLSSLMPAIVVSSVISVLSYYSCESIELAEDVLVATIRTVLQLSLLAAMLSPLFRFAENQAANASSSLDHPTAQDPKSTMGLWGKMKAWSHKKLMKYSAPLMVLSYVFCFMLPLAAYEASSRSKLTLRNPTLPYNNRIVLLIVMVSLFTGVSIMGAIAIFAIVKPVPRYSPRHVIPLCGMLFNNSLSFISLALDVLFTELQSKQRETIELMISFGASAFTATRPSFRSVLASGLKPQINSMNVLGLVSIPGMMTGQVLGGASPTRAARYQMIIMCLILGCGFISVGMTVELVIWNAFDERGALRDDWIVDNDSLRVSELISSLVAVPSAQSGWVKNEDGQSPLQDPSGVEDLMVAVELSTQVQKEAKQSSENPPLFQANLQGKFAKGKRMMRANFTIPNRGDIAILQGVSGIGKSVLLKTVAMLNSGFIPDSPSSMTIALSGKNSELFQPTEWRQHILYLPQQGSSSLRGTPGSFLRFITSTPNHKHSTEPRTLESLTSQTSRYMIAWGVQASKLLQPWSKLSGGESQRVLLAIALATKPSLLLLDEPTSALDNESKMKVEASLKESAESGCAMILVTHDEDQMKRLGTVQMTLKVASL